MNEMEDRTNIVVIDLDEISCRVTQAILQEMPGIDVHAETQDFAKGLDLIKQRSPEIVILNIFPDQDSVFETAKKISQGFPESDLFITSRQADSIVVIRAMRAGAREFISQPVKKDELITAVSKAVQRKKRVKHDKSCKSKVITLFGAKGGVGTTTICTNMATSLSLLTKKDVIILDLNLQFGCAALLLNTKIKYTVFDIVKNIDHIDLTVIKKLLPKSDAGVSILAPPHELESADLITGEHVEQVIMLMRKIYDYIIIDASQGFDDVTIKAMDESDRVLIISSLDVPTIFNTKRCLNLFQKMGYSEEKVSLVINRHSPLDDINFPSIEKVYDYPVFWRLPNQEDESVLTSINKGIPISQWMPNAKISQNITKLVRNFNGAIPPEACDVKMKNRVPFMQKLLKQQVT
jgi:pilus assembly protein CpaE